MSAKDRIKVTKQSRQESQSLRAVEDALDPWRITWVDGRDDCGRDGFIQLIDELPDASGAAAPLTAAIQVKSEGTPLGDRHLEPLETRHVALWSDDCAPSTLVVVWSKSTSELRWRTACEIVRELAVLRPHWREQGEVGVEFRKEHTFAAAADARRFLYRRIADESDRFGGRARHHKFRRRALLTDVYLQTTPSSHSFTLKGIEDHNKDNELIVVQGPGWLYGDIDAADILATRVLAGAALLYEEVWLPFWSIRAVVGAIGREALLQMLRSDRMSFFELSSTAGFHYRRGEMRGSLMSYGRASQPEQADGVLLRQQLVRLLGSSDDEVAEAVLRRTVSLGPEFGSRVLTESNRDLSNRSLRDLLGLGPKSGENESIWDAPLANRVVHMNLAMAVANTYGVDVVEYESGLSRLAAEKWYTTLGFDRTYQTPDAFDAILRQGGVPDLGRLVGTVGTAELITASHSEAAQEFRDWFWEVAAPLAGSGANIDQAFVERLRTALASRAEGLGTLNKLKLRLFHKIGETYFAGAPTAAASAFGFSTRAERGFQVLRMQAAAHATRRRASVFELVGRLVQPYEACPCGSGNKFRFCCGRVP